VPRDFVPLTPFVLADAQSGLTRPKARGSARPPEGARALLARPKARAQQRRLARARRRSQDADRETVVWLLEGSQTGLSAVDSARIAHHKGPKTLAATRPARLSHRDT
jgi:hypothetical protein